MRRQTFGRHGRRGTALAASAAVLCLGGVLTGCGGGAGDGDGYTAVGAAGAGPGKSPSGAVAPSGKVTLIPLDGARDGSGAGKPSGGNGAAELSGASPSPGSSVGAPARDGDTGASGGAGTETARPGASGGTGTETARPGASGGPTQTSGASGGPAASGTPPNGSGPSDNSTGSTGTAGPTPPPAPAVIQVGAPMRAAADERWCEEVTVEFRNTGGSPARSGTVTFATHIIGGLGIDWATRESTAPLPVPIGAGAARKKTYTVCVDAWRVPLGMRIETRDVTAVWK
ncbi:hypothetical protein [Streptomyces sp. NPDC096323]|uniref:hypothetical protein n=1 Tax=Streptomyces sp. NPDC096323 TaxID=3155822 RepID=UPI00332B9913